MPSINHQPYYSFPSTGRLLSLWAQLSSLRLANLSTTAPAERYWMMAILWLRMLNYYHTKSQVIKLSWLLQPILTVLAHGQLLYVAMPHSCGHRHPICQPQSLNQLLAAMCCDADPAVHSAHIDRLYLSTSPSQQIRELPDSSLHGICLYKHS